MSLFFTLIFVLSSILIVYTYLGYYILLYCMAAFTREKIVTKDMLGDYLPVSFLIAAYNEEAVIGKKIDNIFNLNYPTEKISIYVVSDRSTDRTHEIVSSYGNESVHLIISPERRGKTHCENMALKEIKDDLIVFTDASAMLDPDCLLYLIRHFKLGNIGCVSTTDRSIYSDANRGENLYVKYEMFIRTLESKVTSLVGLSGSCYASRSNLCTELPNHLTRDFALPLLARERGYLSVDEPKAVCYVKPTENQKNEFARKVRTFTNGISTLFYKKSLLNIFKYGKFSFILWSHKLFRWLLPFFFIGVFIANVMLFNLNIFYKLCLLFQVMFYILAFFGSKSKSDNFIVKLLRMFHFLCMTNVASIVAWYNFFTDNRLAKWEPTERSGLSTGS